MAETRTPNDGFVPDVLFRSTDVDTAGAEDIFDGAKTVTWLYLDNTANGGAASYFKGYNLREVDASSDVPDLKIKAAASQDYNVFIADGLNFATGFTLRCVTGTADTDVTDPGSAATATVVGT